MKKLVLLSLICFSIFSCKKDSNSDASKSKNYKLTNNSSAAIDVYYTMWTTEQTSQGTVQGPKDFHLVVSKGKTVDLSLKVLTDNTPTEVSEIFTAFNLYKGSVKMTKEVKYFSDWARSEVSSTEINLTLVVDDTYFK